MKRRSVTRFGNGSRLSSDWGHKGGARCCSFRVRSTSLTFGPQGHSHEPSIWLRFLTETEVRVEWLLCKFNGHNLIGIE